MCPRFHFLNYYLISRVGQWIKRCRIGQNSNCTNNTVTPVMTHIWTIIMMTIPMPSSSPASTYLQQVCENDVMKIMYSTNVTKEMQLRQCVILCNIHKFWFMWLYPQLHEVEVVHVEYHCPCVSLCYVNKGIWNFIQNSMLEKIKINEIHVVDIHILLQSSLNITHVTQDGSDLTSLPFHYGDVTRPTWRFLHEYLQIGDRLQCSLSLCMIYTPQSLCNFTLA